MTVLYGSETPNGNSDRGTTSNAENMTDNQIEIGQLLNRNEKAVDEEDDNVYIFPDSVHDICQHEMGYKCVFHLEPDMLNYYYTPAPSVYSRSTEGKPITVLQGSPQFDGFYETKWQVSVNLDQWIGRHRWMSIYLTRVDQNLSTFGAQCEFKLVGKNGQVVFSQRNNIVTSGDITKGMSIGFKQFLPFSDVVKHLIDGNKLSMDLHLVLFSSHSENRENAQIQQGWEEGHPQESFDSQNMVIDDDDCFSYPFPASIHEDISSDISLENVPNSDIPEDDRIELQLNDVRVAYAYREKLIEKSTIYLQCIKHEWDCLGLVNLQLFSKDSPKKQIQAIRDYVNFIHGQKCATLENGSYRDVQVLLQLSLKLGTEDLSRRCLTVMTFKVDCEIATDHSRILQKCVPLVNQDDFDYFKKFFKDNFLVIRKTQRYIQLKQNKTLSDWLIRSLFD